MMPSVVPSADGKWSASCVKGAFQIAGRRFKENASGIGIGLFKDGWQRMIRGTKNMAGTRQINIGFLSFDHPYGRTFADMPSERH